MNKKNVFLLIIVIFFMLIALVTVNKDEKEINFEVLFNGLITFDESLGSFPPNEIIVLTSKEEWEDFGKKYLPNHYERLRSHISFLEKKWISLMVI